MLHVTQNPPLDHPQPVKVLGHGILAALGGCACVVVEMPDRRIERLLSRRHLHRLLGRSVPRIHPQAHEVKLPSFLASQTLKSFITNDLIVKSNPIWYRAPSGVLAAGYRATLLADVCSIYLQARELGVLRRNQLHLAAHCLNLLLAFAAVGIDALIDEATGFQEHRPTDALHELFKAYLRAVPGRWQKVFPDAYYAEAHRLHRLPYTPGCPQHPKVIAFFTRRYVYNKVIPPLVMTEMDRLNPLSDTFTRNRAIHQWLTEDCGVQAVRAQVARVTDRAILAADMPHFLSLTARAEGDPQRVWSFIDTARYPEVPHG